MLRYMQERMCTYKWPRGRNRNHNSKLKVNWSLTTRQGKNFTMSIWNLKAEVAICGAKNTSACTTYIAQVVNILFTKIRQRKNSNRGFATFTSVKSSHWFKKKSIRRRDMHTNYSDPLNAFFYGVYPAHISYGNLSPEQKHKKWINCWVEVGRGKSRCSSSLAPSTNAKLRVTISSKESYFLVDKQELIAWQDSNCQLPCLISTFLTIDNYFHKSNILVTKYIHLSLNVLSFRYFWVHSIGVEIKRHQKQKDERAKIRCEDSEANQAHFIPGGISGHNIFEQLLKSCTWRKLVLFTAKKHLQLGIQAYVANIHW